MIWWSTRKKMFMVDDNFLLKFEFKDKLLQRREITARAFRENKYYPWLFLFLLVRSKNFIYFYIYIFLLCIVRLF